MTRSKLSIAQMWAAGFTVGVYLAIALIAWVIAWLADPRPGDQCGGNIAFNCPRDVVLIFGYIGLQLAAVGAIVACVLVGAAPRIEGLRDRSPRAIGGWAAAMVWLVVGLILSVYVLIGLAG
jgi:hypothetical protein